MSDIALCMDRVYKKLRKGEMYNCLRDLIPAMTGRLFRHTEIDGKDSREFWALQDISFEVPRGQALGIVGRNGAGKSTVLKILSRIMKPTKGRMIVNGRLCALIEVTAGFHQDLTGRENIFLNGTILGMSKREIQNKLDQIIAFSGLNDFIDTPVKRYSSGMYARLGFSVAAHVDPDILIVDEILSVGDFDFQKRCLDRMREVLTAGSTVLFVSHDLKAVTELCQRAVLLDRGRIVTSGPTGSVIQRYLSDGFSKINSERSETVYLSNVEIHGETGEQLNFESGQTAWVDIEVTARKATDNLAISVWLNDESHHLVFETSTERMGLPPFALHAGETYRGTLELSLNMAHGSFSLGMSVYGSGTQEAHDKRDPMATLFIGSTRAVRGSVNCFPRFTEMETVTPGAQPLKARRAAAR